MELLKPKVKFSGKLYRNNKLAEFIGCFVSVAQRDAAWATALFIRETWPETDAAIRGDLIAEDEGDWE